MKWILLALLPSAALAEGPLDQYMVDLPQCFYAAADQAEQEACIGVYADLCMQEAPDGMSNLGMTECFQAEADAWDTLLNDEYHAALDWAEGMDAEDRTSFPEYAVRVDQVTEAQRAWVAFRDTNCAMQYGLWGSGSMRYPFGATCLMTMTAARTIDLNRYYTAMAGE